MSDTATARERLDIGRVLRTTVEVTRRNIGPMLLLAALFGSLPNLVIGLAGLSLHATEQIANSLDQLVGAVTNAILQGAVIHLTLRSLEDGEVSWTQSMSVGLRTWWSLLRVGFLLGLGVILGLVLLVVPGVFVGVMWCVAAPALIVERLGVSRALSRSAELTKGHRWKVLALLAIFWAVAIVLIIVISGLIGMMAPASAAALVAGVIAALLLGLLNGPIFAVLYTELRRLKEGATQIAAVFD